MSLLFSLSSLISFLPSGTKTSLKQWGLMKMGNARLHWLARTSISMKGGNSVEPYTVFATKKGTILLPCVIGSDHFFLVCLQDLRPWMAPLTPPPPVVHSWTPSNVMQRRWIFLFLILNVYSCFYFALGRSMEKKKLGQASGGAERKGRVWYRGQGY